MKLLLDMNMSPRLVEPLRSAGHECAHWSSVGKSNAPDREVMRWAEANGAVLITHDLDFSAILTASGAAGPSVLQVRNDDLSATALLERVTRALSQAEEELRRGAVVSLDVKRSRLRLLPLRREQ